MNNWPENDDAITGIAHNGEVPEHVTYQIGETLYRVNPVGRYSLYFNGKAWRESACVTNDMLNGESK